MIETAHGILLFGLEWALNDEGKAKADVGGIFATNKNRVGADIEADRHFHFFARLEIPVFKHVDDFALAATEAASNNELHIGGRVSAAMMLADVLELDIIDSLEAFGIS